MTGEIEGLPLMVKVSSLSFIFIVSIALLNNTLFNHPLLLNFLNSTS